MNSIKQTRITLVISAENAPHEWLATEESETRILTVPFRPQLLRDLFDASTADLDIERVILDRVGTPNDFQHVLNSMPSGFAGEAMVIRADGSGFLSALSRSAGRVLYGLGAFDLDFYLRANGIIEQDRPMNRHLHAA